MPLTRNTIVAITTRVAVCGALLLLGTAVFGVLVLTKPRPAVVAERAGARPVEVMRVTAVPVRREWSGFGTAAAIHSADVPAEVAGIVAEVPGDVVAGAPVRRGDTLALIDSADYAERVEIVSQQLAESAAQVEQLAVEEASWSQRVELAVEQTRLARLEVERVTAAAERGVALPREVDRARTSLHILERAETAAREELDKIAPRRAGLLARQGALKAELSQARRNLERCTVRSPLGGFLQSVDVERGERVEVGRVVARVVDLSAMEVPVRLPASARAVVAVGDHCVLEAQGPVDQSWQARVDRIAPEDDRATRTMSVYVELDQDTDDRGLLVPGRFVRGTVTSGVVMMRTVVPRRSIMNDRIQVVESNVVRSRPVRVDFHVRRDYPQLGVEAEQWAVLADDLAPGTLVVINAARSLPDGISVDPVELERGDAARAQSGARGGLPGGSP